MPESALEMDCEAAQKLWESIDALEAQEMLLLLKVADFPNMKDEDRRELHQRLFKTANPFHVRRALSTDELRARLMGGG